VKQAESHIRGDTITCGKSLELKGSIQRHFLQLENVFTHSIFQMPYKPLSGNSFTLDFKNTDLLALAGDRGKRI